MHLLVIGGSDAGISAALRAHELAPDTEITLLLADDYPNFSICGLPYFLSGETPDWRDLAHRSEFPGIDVRRRHVARSIDPGARRVRVEHDGRERDIDYDRLVIATGARPIRPSLPGSDLDGVFLLHTMDDSFAVKNHIAHRHPRTAAIVGAGYIGIEMADALTQTGIAVTLFSRSETVLPTVDPSLGRLIQTELERHDVRVETGVGVERIEQVAGGESASLSLTDSSGRLHQADLILLAVGVRPDSDLARAAGANLGARDAIAISRAMETSLPDVFAAGDCVETHHRQLADPTYISLGTIAHKQGRVAGENALGGDRRFPGTLGTQAIKIFDLAVARSGLSDSEAVAAGLAPLTVEVTANDHKGYYPGATPLTIRMTGDRHTGRLIGAQILGHRGAEISKRIDIVAAALHHYAGVDDLNDLDLSYTPPFSSPWDPVQIAAQAWLAAARD